MELEVTNILNIKTISQAPKQPLTGEFIALDSAPDATAPPPGPSHKIKRRRSSRRSKRKSLREPEVMPVLNHYTYMYTMYYDIYMYIRIRTYSVPVYVAVPP